MLKGCHRIIMLLGLVFIIVGCGQNKKADISGIEINQLVIKRYGKDLFEIDPQQVREGLDKLSDDYAFFLGDNYDDTLNLIQIRDYITDPLLLEISEASLQVYPDLKDIESELTEAFKYYLYYFEGENIPSVFTYISGIDIDNRVELIDTVMIIAIDSYLGKDFEIYKRAGIPRYKAQRMEKPYIVPDCMRVLIKNRHMPSQKGSRLIDYMIHEGKTLYSLDCLLPGTHDSLKIGYTGSQLGWCRANEKNLWAFLIENQMLYSSDYEKFHKLVNDGPFTSYFSEESPARTAIWLGWNIVREYMENNKVELQELLKNTDHQQILTDSGYKP